MKKPPPEVVRAFNSTYAEIIRRIEIYEEDGVTPWRADLWPRILLGGTVTIDHDRDERRNVDMELANLGGELYPEAGELWYDKIFKLYYGIKMNQRERKVKVAIIEQYSADDQALRLRQHLQGQGISQVYYLPHVVTYDQVQDYDVIVAISGTEPQKMALLNTCYANGKAVFTLSSQPGAANPTVGSADQNTAVPTGQRVVSSTGVAHPMSTGWDAWSYTTTSSVRKMYTVGTGTVALASVADSTGTSTFMLARDVIGGSRWLHVGQSDFGPGSFPTTDDYNNFGRFAAAAIRWLNPYTPINSWECCVGAFLADSISDDDKRGTIKIVGRDLTKLCMKSQLPVAITFAKGKGVESIVKAVASNAGIRNFDLPVTKLVLDKDMTWERGTSRWDVMKAVANAYNYDIYFDAEGFLAMKEFQDPLLSPVEIALSTGAEGNLVSRGAKTSDTRLFNHIVVVGESSNSATPPVYAEAKNTNPNSPSRISEIGDRVEITTSSLVTSVVQAQKMADSLLAVAALEEFELAFEVLAFPWLEVGDILEMVEDDDYPYWGPDRYMLTSLSLPFDTSPMSGNGKRVVKGA